jgi:hypothetical protein
MDVNDGLRKGMHWNNQSEFTAAIAGYKNWTYYKSNAYIYFISKQNSKSTVKQRNCFHSVERIREENSLGDWKEEEINYEWNSWNWSYPWTW